MHHKRGRRKNARAGCLLCKPHKANGCRGGRGNRRRMEERARISGEEQVARADDWWFDLYELSFEG